MYDPGDLVPFYERSYEGGSDADLHSRWRALGAVGKAGHVLELCRRAAVQPTAVLEVGCGDGALLSELHRRGFGDRLAGVELAPAAARLAAARPGIESVAVYDGERLPFADGEFDLAIVSHVLEHVPDPAALMAESARAAAVVICEVPLERNLSALRPSRRRRSGQVGHIQRLDRAAVHDLAASAGLRIEAEVEDPLPLEVHRFFARGTRARAAALARWALRAGVHRTAPALARRSFTLHYACLCRPRAGSRPRAGAPERVP